MINCLPIQIIVGNGWRMIVIFATNMIMQLNLPNISAQGLQERVDTFINPKLTGV